MLNRAKKLNQLFFFASFFFIRFVEKMKACVFFLICVCFKKIKNDIKNALKIIKTQKKYVKNFCLKFFFVVLKFCIFLQFVKNY